MVQKWLQTDQLKNFLLIECLGLGSFQGPGEESKDVEETKIGLELKAEIYENMGVHYIIP